MSSFSGDTKAGLPLGQGKTSATEPLRCGCFYSQWVAQSLEKTSHCDPSGAPSSAGLVLSPPRPSVRMDFILQAVVSLFLL